jgi:lipid-binding SYLF domain-containing protein
MKTTQRIIGALLALATGAVAGPALADHEPATSSRAKMLSEAESTAAAFRHADPTLSRFFGSSAGYAVFPTVGKGGAGVGGAYGRGVLYERGHPVGQTTLTQVTVGAQLGGQAYSELVFFEGPEALQRFKKGEFAMAAEVSAVIAATGASANAKYARGVAVFTLAKGGLMAEASIGGQKFAFKPFATPVSASAERSAHDAK